ncbi:MAG: hypothetical protein P1V20_31285, partial [Verrucomicrobiales bacterium]|nr:hypothetical protein [Verrucomicrobiales bacterium]
RGQSGDAEEALEQYVNSLGIAQKLYEANPNSAQAARDLSVSLERLGDFYLGRGQSGDAEEALEQYVNSLDVRQKLYEANSNSAQAARDLVVSHYKLAQVNGQMDRKEDEINHLFSCFTILDLLHRERRSMDQQMVGLYHHLASRLGSSGQD